MAPKEYLIGKLQRMERKRIASPKLPLKGLNSLHDLQTQVSK